MRYGVRLGVSTVIALSFVGLAAACGGSDAVSSPAPASSATGFAAYTECLGRNGVTLPSRGPGRSPRPSGSARPSRSPGESGFGGGGGFGGGFSTQAPAGVDQATWTKAQAACASVRPSAGPGRGNSAFAAYRNCLTEHGVTLPSTGARGQLNTADPAAAAAAKICAPLRPTTQPSATSGN